MRSFYIFLSGVFVLMMVFVGIAQANENKTNKTNEQISVYMDSLTSVLSKELYRFFIGYKQGLDTSCGIAATATLLRFFYTIDIDEKQLINLFFTELKKKDDYTLSMLDIKTVLEYYGFIPIGMKIEKEMIFKFNKYAPFIVHIEKPQKHFSIYIGSYGQYLMFADPSIGLFFESIDEFKEKFSGYILVPEGKEPDKKVLTDIKNFLKMRIKQLYEMSGIKI